MAQRPVTQRLGLFGGSFDPVHNAHVALARSAIETLALEQVLWIPVGAQPQKATAISAAAHRSAMVLLAIADEPRFVLERCELERSGPSYTIDTVRQLQAARPDAALTLIIGADQYAGMHTWGHWRELLDHVTLAVARRPGVPLPIAEVQQHPHRVVPLPMLDISSTDIRARVANGEPIADLVPPRVARYIDQQGLYRSPPTRS